MGADYTPLGLWVIGQFLNGPVIDVDFYKENNVSKFRAIIIKKGTYRAGYGILFPQYTSMGALTSSADPIFNWSYGNTFINRIWSGLFLTPSEFFPVVNLGIAPTKNVSNLVAYRFRFYNTLYYVVSGPETRFVQAVNGNFTNCTIEQTVDCAPSLSLSSGILTVTYNVSIPFRCIKGSILRLKLKHNLRFFTTSASTTYDLLL